MFDETLPPRPFPRRTGYVGEGKKAFLRLKREVLDQILLRRTKSNRSNDICLPPRIVRVRKHCLDEREEVRIFLAFFPIFAARL